MARTLPNDKWARQFVCKGCRKFVEAYYDDVEFDAAAGAEAGGPGLDFFVVCPGCGVRGYIPSGEMPASVEASARRRASR